MGTQLDDPAAEPLRSQWAAPVDEHDIPAATWLDDETAGLVRSISTMVAREHPALFAVILFGSVARHDERPLSDDKPSDVDLLLLFDVGDSRARLPEPLALAVCSTIGRALDRHPHAPREVQTVLAVRDLWDWDPLFVENVAREGILLWARGPLPEHLAAVGERRTR